MKIRQGFVSNSSSSSFVIALPNSYTISDEEMSVIRDEMEDYDEYFSYYAEKAEADGHTEVLDEREKLQNMLDSGNFEEPEEVEPVNDDVKNADIKKGFEFLITKGYFWFDELDGNNPALYAAKAIVAVLKDKITIGYLDTSSDAGQIINILASSYEDKKAMQLLKEHFKNEN